MKHALLPLLLGTALLGTAAVAEEPGRPTQPPGQTLPLKPARTLTIDTDGGSWMSLDVSPDGKAILFDMLGDLYSLPAAGGKARQITHGLGFDTQPTFSPDGQWIVFVSDRSGAENLWVARPDGSQPRQVTFGDDDTVLTSPAWSADGKALFVSRFRPDFNNYELWQYDLLGVGKLLAPIQPSAGAPRTAWQSTLGPSAAPDGKSLYYARRVGGIDFDEIDAWNIIRRDLATGKEMIVVTGSGGRGADHETFFRPQIAPDGHRLAYATRRAGRTELRLRDLATGEDRLITAPLDPDQLESSSWQDILPRYAFSPAGDALLLSRANHIERITLADGAVTPVPFTAHMQVAVGPLTRQHIREDNGPVRAWLIQAPIASPDGKQVAFSTMGSLYIQPFDGSTPPRRLGAGFQPSWSPDGKHIAYVTWSEEDGGAIWSVAADGSGAPARVSDIPAFYTYPVFTPDGATILSVRSSAAVRQRTSFEFGKTRQSEFVALPANGGGAARIITSGKFGGRPNFVRDMQGVAFLFADDGLNRIDLAKGTRFQLVQVKGPGYYFVHGTVPADDIKISPDGKWLLAQVVQQVYLLPVPAAGTTVDLTEATSPHRRLTDGGADFADWTADGRIDWTAGPTIARLAPADTLKLTETAAATPVAKLDIRVEVPRDRPHGTILLRGARAMTMAGGDRVIDDADILVTDDRIAAIGPRDSFAVPAGTVIRDLAGKTILPGFIDVHDHIGEVRREVLSGEDWGLRARLAYGVTTSFDPSTLSIDMLGYQDMLDAGLMVGPRLRSTGPALFSMNRFTSLDQVRAVLRRYRDQYGLRNLKEYRVGSRKVREWFIIAARELGMNVTTEGALSLKLDLSQILDGYAGNEHALPAVPLGPDIVALLAAMRTSYTTTLMVTNSGPTGADWFVENEPILADPRTTRFWPPGAIEQKLTSREWRPLRDYRFSAIAPGAAAVAKAGGLVGMGAHGEVPGAGFHWEMQAHVMGGMAPLAVLHAATAGSAETIGRLDDLGTIEPGKLADLVILDRDPLVDIRNTQGIAAVMRGGRLYDGQTLDEIYPDPHPLPAPWFATSQGREAWLPAPRQP
jgi:Tol biopolymer transport system component